MLIMLISQSFDEQNSVKLFNPLSQDLDVMRQTLFLVV